MMIVLMGVSGSGKTLIGTMLAQCLGFDFLDADDFHSPENKQKMAAGQPLTDEDRLPWLQRLNQLLLERSAAETSGVLACSALKQSYRDTLVEGLPKSDRVFVWLDAPKRVISARLAGRHNHFMNPKLLDSQLATLELPNEALRLQNDRAPRDVVQEIMSHLGMSPATTQGLTKREH